MTCQSTTGPFHGTFTPVGPLPATYWVTCSTSKPSEQDLSAIGAAPFVVMPAA
jgi:hypothetical protein